MLGFFGNLFDFNNDGSLDGFERVVDFVAFTSMLEEFERENTMNDVGFELEELAFMDDDERRIILEDAGLNPDDYEF